MQELGYNYRITDLQCALGRSQLKKLDGFLEKRRKLAAAYDHIFKQCDNISPLKYKDGVLHAYHLYVVKIPAEKRETAFEYMRSEGIGVNVHYIPVHYHPYYRENFNTAEGLCPVSEKAYDQLLTLPLHPAMSGDDVNLIAEKLKEALKRS